MEFMRENKPTKPATDSQEYPNVAGPGPHGRLNHCDTCWKDSPARHKQSRSPLEGIDENCLTQVTQDLMRKGAQLDLTLQTKKETVL